MMCCISPSVTFWEMWSSRYCIVFWFETMSCSDFCQPRLCRPLLKDILPSDTTSPSRRTNALDFSLIRLSNRARGLLPTLDVPLIDDLRKNQPRIADGKDAVCSCVPV